MLVVSYYIYYSCSDVDDSTTQRKIPRHYTRVAWQPPYFIAPKEGKEGKGRTQMHYSYSHLTGENWSMAQTKLIKRNMVIHTAKPNNTFGTFWLDLCCFKSYFIPKSHQHMSSQNGSGSP